MEIPVFVYGTLKVGGRLASDFDKYRINSTKGKLLGYDMFSCGSFPAIVKGKGVVSGELHNYSNFRAVLARMDMIEGYRPSNINSMYIRKIVKVAVNCGVVEAWVYIWNGPTNDLLQIEEGVWK